MLVEDVVVQRHLVGVYALLNTELGLHIAMSAPRSTSPARPATYDHDIKGAVEYANDLGGADDRAVLLGKIVDKVAQVQMGRLLLGDLGGIYRRNPRIRLRSGESRTGHPPFLALQC